MAPDINNAGKVHTCGDEISFQAKSMTRLSFFDSLGVLETEVDQWR